MTELRIVDLDADDLTWGQHAIAGAERPAGIVMLRMDAERGTRSCVVAFPEGWRRDVTGNQPAAEEMAVLSGVVTMSGLTCNEGEVLVVEPRATRTETFVTGRAIAVVWFSGPGGGWADGVAPDAGAAQIHTADSSFHRAERDGLVGTLSGHDDVSGRIFDVDVEVLWPTLRMWAFVPAGQRVPEFAGFALVHTY